MQQDGQAECGRGNIGVASGMDTQHGHEAEASAV